MLHTRRRHSVRFLLAIATLLLSASRAIGAKQDESGRTGEEVGEAQDRGAFSSRGHIPQLDFALLAASKHSLPSLCLRTRRSCLLISMRQPSGAEAMEDLASAPAAAKKAAGGDGPVGSGLYRITPSLGCLCTGMPSDARTQLGLLREEAESYRRVFGHDIPSRVLALRLADALQGQGQRSWTRPPACITVLAGHDDEQLYRIDCTGQVCGMRAVPGGSEGDKAVEVVEKAITKEGLLEDEDEEEEGQGWWQRVWELLRHGWQEDLGGKGADAFDVARVRRGEGFTYLGTLDTLLLTTTTTTTTTKGTVTT